LLSFAFLGGLASLATFSWPVVFFGVAGLHGCRRALGGWEEVKPEKTTAQKALLALLLLDRRRVAVRARGVFDGLLLRLATFGRDLVHQVALLVVDGVHEVALLVGGALDRDGVALLVLALQHGVALLVGGRLAHRLEALRQALGYLAGFVLLFLLARHDLVYKVALLVVDGVHDVALLVFGALDRDGVALLVLALQHGVALLVGERLSHRLEALRQAVGQFADGVLRLICGVTHGTLGLIRHLTGLVRRLTSDALRLIGKPTDGVLGLPSHLTGLVGHLARGVLHLPRCLAGGVLRLARYLLRLVRRPIGRTLPGRLVGVLPSLLGRLLQRVLHARVLRGLIYGALELGVGVGHLLNLGLRFWRKLLHEALELRAVALHLALNPAHRLPEELLGLLQVLLLLRLLSVLSLLAHSVSSSLSVSLTTAFCLTCSELVYSLSLFGLFSKPGSSSTTSVAMRNRTSASR
jgi:hypothetical protein